MRAGSTRVSRARPSRTEEFTMVADARVAQLAVVVPVPARVGGVVPPRPSERYPAPALSDAEPPWWGFCQDPCVSHHALHLASLTIQTTYVDAPGGWQCWQAIPDDMRGYRTLTRQRGPQRSKFPVRV
jgi:hypothetical protein